MKGAGFIGLRAKLRDLASSMTVWGLGFRA